jgi:hypothetical protein
MKYSISQLYLLYSAATSDLRARLSRRHCYKSPVCGFPADPGMVKRQYSEIRELIDAIRRLGADCSKAERREAFLQLK